jgi:hypothetical protein
MSRYSGRYHKGASKDAKAEKRAEAEFRAERRRVRLALIAAE